MSRFQFVHDHRDTYEVKRLCQVLDVNRSSYYKWVGGAGARTARRREDQALAEQIRSIHADSGGTYGSPRVTAELRETGARINHKRVARLMRTHDLAGGRPGAGRQCATRAMVSPGAALLQPKALPRRAA